MLLVNRNLTILILVLLITILSVVSYLAFQQTSINKIQDQIKAEKEAATQQFRVKKYVPKYNGKGF